MTPWFLRDPKRLTAERSGIDELLARPESWLIGAQWTLVDGGLCIDAIIRSHGYDYEIRLTFPTLFPDVPIYICPQNENLRISTHQYGGVDGPLCLEWGPDNWHSGITAVQMLESTYRLLEIENPRGKAATGSSIIAPSRHHLSVGQELRTERSRWYYSKEFENFLRGQAAFAVGGFKFSWRILENSQIVLIHEAKLIGQEPAWCDKSVPTVIPDATDTTQFSGIWIKTDLPADVISGIQKLNELRVLLANQNGHALFATDGSAPVEGFNRTIAGVLIVDSAGLPHFSLVLHGEDVISRSMVQSNGAPDPARAPDEAGLRGKSVGIVGLGSAGSKIALSLARMGIKTFYLSDYDVLLPENLRRNALNWQNVTEHKVDAVSHAIRLIAPDAKVEVSRLHLTGQESSASVSGVLARLGGCDLIIDATANPRVFNLLASVARMANRPMVWLEIFAGGIGGLIARSRPGLDSSPQEIRSSYLQFCSNNPFPLLAKIPRNYSLETEDGEVLSASDADVGVIADHSARLACDCLASKEASIFPHSFYLIGLKKGWIFEAPFATVPLALDNLNTAPNAPVNDPQLDPENVAFLINLLGEKDAPPSSS